MEKTKIQDEKKLKDVDRPSKSLRTKTINLKKFKDEKNIFYSFNYDKSLAIKMVRMIGLCDY